MQEKIKIYYISSSLFLCKNKITLTPHAPLTHQLSGCVCCFAPTVALQFRKVRQPELLPALHTGRTPPGGHGGVPAALPGAGVCGWKRQRVCVGVCACMGVAVDVCVPAGVPLQSSGQLRGRTGWISAVAGGGGGVGGGMEHQAHRASRHRTGASGRAWLMAGQRPLSSVLTSLPPSCWWQTKCWMNST